jgi:hypothetical protein
MLDFPLTLTDVVLKPTRLCKITRRDGEIIRIAEAQTDLVVGAETYSPLGGFQLSAVKHTVGGESASVQIDAAMSIGGAFDTYEVVDGKFDYATVQIYVVNRATLTSPGLMFTGFVGAVTFGALHNVVSINVPGYSIKAKWPFAQTFGPMCRTDFGSDLCRVPLRPSLLGRNTAYVTRANATSVDHYAGRVSNGGTDPDQYANVFFECTTGGTTAGSAPSFNFSVGATTTDGTAVFTARDAWTRHAKITSIANQFNIVLDRDPDPRGITGWYNQGAIRMWDGYSAGQAFEIGAWVLSTRTITLYLPIGAANNDTLIHAGDWLEIWPGCDFTIAKCEDPYDNTEQFRGEPYFLGAQAAAFQAGDLTSGTVDVSLGETAFVDSAQSVDAGLVYTFSNMSIGAASSTRDVIIGVIGGQASGAGNVTAVSVGGIAATQVAEHTQHNMDAEIWKVNVPTGTTASVVVTWGTIQIRCLIAVWASGDLLAVVDTDGGATGVVLNSANVTVNTVVGGFVVGMGYHNNVVIGALGARGFILRETIDIPSSNAKVGIADIESASSSLTCGFDLGGGADFSLNSCYVVASFSAP